MTDETAACGCDCVGCDAGQHCEQRCNHPPEIPAVKPLDAEKCADCGHAPHASRCLVTVSDNPPDYCDCVTPVPPLNTEQLSEIRRAPHMIDPETGERLLAMLGAAQRELATLQEDYRLSTDRENELAAKLNGVEREVEELRAEITRSIPWINLPLRNASISEEQIREWAKGPGDDNLAELSRCLLVEHAIGGRLEDRARNARASADIRGVALEAAEARVTALEAERDQAREAVQQLSAGKPLGPIVGAQTIVNQAKHIRALEAALAKASEWIGRQHTECTCDVDSDNCPKREQVELLAALARLPRRTVKKNSELPDEEPL